MALIEIHVRRNNFPKLRRELDDNVEAVVAKAAHDIEGRTKANIAGHGLIDTGNMLNSVRAAPLGRRRWHVIVGAHYGIYHEMGTVRLPARPFLGPAADAVRPGFLSALEKVLG